MQQTRALSTALVFIALVSQTHCLIDFSQNTPNPFQGQNLPPTGQSIRNFPVQVYALVEDLYRVDEQLYTFTLVFGLLLQYDDPATVSHVLEDSSTGCSFYCASDPTVTLNNEGDPACCDNAFIPGLQAVNLISYEGQETPAQYQLSVLSNSTVAYYTKARGTFSTDLRYDAYPFDKHFLAVDFLTPFQPLEDGGTFIESTQATLAFANKADSGYKDSYRPSVTAIDLPAWRVVYTHFEVMNFTTEYARGGKNARGGSDEVTLSELSGRGFRIALEVERQQAAFYIVVEIIPICLIVAFSFACFSLPIQNVKARFNVLAGQFLTLIVLQFILYTVLPATFQVIKPYILICVSYVMTFAMCGEVIIASWILNQYKRSMAKKARSNCRSEFRQWKDAFVQTQNASLLATPPQHSLANGAMDEEADHSSESSSVVSIEEGRRGASGGQLVDKSPALRPSATMRQAQTAQTAQRWKGSWMLRTPCVREVVLAWLYMGRPDSQEFCMFVAKVFDRVVCLFLATAYFIIVIVIYCLAARDATASADYA